MSKRSKFVRIFYLITAFLLIGSFSGCSNKSTGGNKNGSTEPAKADFSIITPEEAKKRLDSEENIILLDVRTVEEYESGHIKDSILIPVDKLESEAEKSLKDKDAPIFVYCRSGNRSTTAANILIDLGYKNVYNLGGIINWPYEVVR